MTTIRSAQQVVEVLTTGTPKIQSAQLVLEVLIGNTAVTWENSLTIAGTSACAGSHTLTLTSTLTAAGTSAFAESYAVLLPGSVSLDGTSAFASSFVTVLAETVTLAGTSDFSLLYEILSLDGVTLIALGDFTCTGEIISYDSMSLGSVGDCSSPGGISFASTLIVASISDFSSSGIVGFSSELSIDGTSSLNTTHSVVSSEVLSLDSVGDVSTDFEYSLNLQLTVDGTCDLAVAIEFALSAGFIIAGTSSFSSPGGVSYFIQRSIEGLSSADGLDGFSLENDFQLDAVSDVLIDFLYEQNELLSIDGICDLTESSQFTANVLFSIAGTALFEFPETVDYVVSIDLSSVGENYFENVYDFLLVSAVYSDITTVLDHQANNNESQAATGSFAASIQAIYNRNVVQTLAFVEELIEKKPTWIMSHSLAFSQVVTKSKIHIDSVTHTLTFTDEAIAARLLQQSLTLTDSVECIKVHSRSLSQTLNFSHAVHRNIVISRAFEESLIFNPPHLHKLPIYGSQNQGGNHQFSYYIPTVYSVLVPRQCLIILGVPSQTVVLPCPIWGDSQSYQVTLDLKRAMTGTTYTYVKKTQTQKLHYSFELWTHKYFELRQFFISHSEEVMMLQNHNAETWLVHLVNNPLEFATEERWQSKGEKYSVTLEFEGVKISG